MIDDHQAALFNHLRTVPSASPHVHHRRLKCVFNRHTGRRRARGPQELLRFQRATPASHEPQRKLTKAFDNAKRKPRRTGRAVPERAYLCWRRGKGGCSMQRFVKTAISELLRRVVPAADRHSPEERHQHRRHHSGDLELGGQGHCGLPGSESAAYTQPRCFRCDADHVSSGPLIPYLCSALGSFPQLTSFTPAPH